MNTGNDLPVSAEAGTGVCVLKRSAIRISYITHKGKRQSQLSQINIILPERKG
jgi:hypothetical protein